MTIAATTAPPELERTVQMLAPGLLDSDPLNPRQRFTDADLAELLDSIATRGEVLLPLLARPGKTKLKIIDGERRWRCALKANLPSIPVVIREMTDSEALELMLLASIQRQDLTPLEEARGFRSLLDSNKAKYSAAYIADRLGRSEKWVVDRMRLLSCIPIVQALLKAERILVGHAEQLAKLKPEDQQDIVTPKKKAYGGGYREGGLWQHETRLEFDDDEKTPSEKNLYAGLKPVTVGELEAWIARHVRFDVEHMAAAAPLDFGETARQVEAAQLKPGRGKKVIQITTDHRATDDVRDDAPDRIYGATSWRRADGQDKSKPCEHSVLGVVVAGAGQGTAFAVCIRRDACQVHFAKEIREREKNAKLRAKGKGGQAAQREAQAEAREKREHEQREAELKAWRELKPKAEAAIVEHIKGLAIGKLVPVAAKAWMLRDWKGPLKTAEDVVRAMAFWIATDHDFNQAELAAGARKVGFDLTAWVKDNTPKPEKAAAAAPAKAKPAKKKR